MNKIIFAFPLLLLLVGCTGMDISKVTKEDINKVIVCDAPYIRHGADCCIDANNNSICDPDETPAIQAAPVQPTVQDSIPIDEPSGETVVVSEKTTQAKPTEIKTCSLDYAIEMNHCEIGTGNIALAIKGQGAAGIKGTWYYITGTDGQIVYFKDTTTAAQNTNINLIIPAHNVAQMMVLPVMDGNACFNQRIIAISKGACVK